MPPQIFRRVLELAALHGIYVFCDEVYRELEHDPGARLPAACDFYERALSLGSVSKTYGLPGLRLGWLACRDGAFLQKIVSLKHYTTICSSAPSEFLTALAFPPSSEIHRSQFADCSPQSCASFPRSSRATPICSSGRLRTPAPSDSLASSRNRMSRPSASNSFNRRAFCCSPVRFTTNRVTFALATAAGICRKPSRRAGILAHNSPRKMKKGHRCHDSPSRSQFSLSDLLFTRLPSTVLPGSIPCRTPAGPASA